MPFGEMTRIVLVGPSGVGKSTLGPFFAKSVGYAFVDMDEAMSARFPGMRVGISERKQVMAELLDRTAVVIAAGSEDFHADIARSDILAKALSIAIIANTAGRIGRSVPGLTNSAPQDKAAAFRAANLHVDTRGLSVFDALDALIDHVRAAAIGIDLSHLRRHEPGKSSQRPHIHASNQADDGGRSRQFLENTICWQVIDALLSDKTCGSAYSAYSGLWHSEGRKVVLLANDPRQASLEIFFFEHGAMPWQTSILVHRDNARGARLDWGSDAATPDGIMDDLSQQLRGAMRGRLGQS